jgi:hypothetical protein
MRSLRLESGCRIGTDLAALELVLVARAGARSRREAGEIARAFGLKRYDFASIEYNFNRVSGRRPQPKMDSSA